jgi:hypothetical protein
MAQVICAEPALNHLDAIVDYIALGLTLHKELDAFRRSASPE